MEETTTTPTTRVKITEIKEYYTVKRKERDKLTGKLVDVERNLFRFREVPYVTGWARFGHFIIDRIIYIVFELIIAFSLGIIIALLGGADWLLGMNENLMDLVLFALTYPLYYFIFEASMQTSLAKMMLGRVVVDEYGDKPTKNQIFKRSVSRIVPFEPFSCFGDTGWHDRWSETFVIRKKDLEELQVLARLQEHLAQK